MGRLILPKVEAHYMATGIKTAWNGHPINETEHRSQKHPHKQNSLVFDNGAPVT